jgi:hypothetical protein
MPDLDIQPLDIQPAAPPPAAPPQGGKLDIQPLDIQPMQQNTAPQPPPEEEPGMVSRAWHMLADPLTDAPSRFAQGVEDYITTPGANDSMMGSMARGFLGGAAKGLGDVASSMTSPMNLATTIASGGASLAAGAEMPMVARGLSMVGKAAGGLTALHGGGQVINPASSLGDRAMGIAEMAGGLAGMKHVPEAPPSKAFVGTAGIEITPENVTRAKNIITKAGQADVMLDMTDNEIISRANSIKPKAFKKAQPPAGADTGATGQPKNDSVPTANDIIDPHAGWRNVPLQMKFQISPENLSLTKMKNAIKLGFQYDGMTDGGKIILRKVKESPALEQMKDPELEKNALAEVANLPRTIMASMDMSAPLRQGIGLIHKGAFWKALPDMVRAWGSEDAYRAIQDSIVNDKSGMFKRTYGADGKIQPSFAEKVGLKLTDLNGQLSNREESIMSSLADKVPMVRASNRAYTAFLNKLRADTFKQMVTDFQSYSGIDARNKVNLSSQIADFVNTASGRGSLDMTTKVFGHKVGVNLENSAGALSTVLFSPRLLASRLQMMGKGLTAPFHPEIYMMQKPNIRREYLKSLASIAGASATFVGISKYLGGAEVESDPASSDFGKVKFGNTRIDPYGGFQQPIVLMQRMMPHIDLSSLGLEDLGVNIGGDMKSTTTGQEYSLDDPAFGRSTRADVLSRFIRSKTNPIINFGWGLLAGNKELSGKPMNFSSINPVGEQGDNLWDNSIAQRFLPMLSQDVYDLVNDETTPPSAKALAAFMASVGMGSQTYGN